MSFSLAKTRHRSFCTHRRRAKQQCRDACDGAADGHARLLSLAQNGGLVRCNIPPTRPDGGGGVTGGEHTGGDLGGPRETDCVPGHIGLEPANPGAGHLIGFA
jgi:hypothetical protein